MIKENLKIRTLSDNERKEAQELLFSMGCIWGGNNKPILFHSYTTHIHYITSTDLLLGYGSNEEYFQRNLNKEITLPELRELARPKEYLNDKFELVVTNMPQDGWRLVPEGANLFAQPQKEIHLGQYFYKVTSDIEYWHPNYNRYCKAGIWEINRLHKILWQRKPKQEEVMTNEIIELDEKQEAKFSEVNYQNKLQGLDRIAARLAVKLNTTGKGLIDYSAALNFAKELSSFISNSDKQEKVVKPRFLHQWAYEAFGRGEDVVYTSEKLMGWRSVGMGTCFEVFNHEYISLRLKPQTIQIGTHTIVKPIDVKPEIEQMYFIACVSGMHNYTKDRWQDDEYDNEMFNRKLCHLNKEDAIKHTEALLSLMGDKQCT